MSIANGYCTLAELKAYLDIDPGDVDDDTMLEACVEAASRAIDVHCGRWFYTTSADETRCYTAEDADLLRPDDLVSITSLYTDDDGDGTFETEWTTSDYYLEPYNAALHGEPYTAIRAVEQAFPLLRRAVRITGKFGWPAVPPDIRQAALLQSARLFKRKDALFGVMGSAEMGQVVVIPKLDPDVAMLIMGRRKVEVLAC